MADLAVLNDIKPVSYTHLDNPTVNISAFAGLNESFAPPLFFGEPSDQNINCSGVTA